MEIKEKCRVTWCDNPRRYKSVVCQKHSQYKHICGAAIRLDRPHLMYKVEKWLKGEHQCESCGFDPVKAYPTLPVSYTHLRAHETPEHLVCRLLLEKKN